MTTTCGNPLGSTVASNLHPTVNQNRGSFLSPRVLLTVVGLSCAALAQPAVGDILGTTFDLSRFNSTTLAGVNTVYDTAPVGGFGGTGTSQSILWHPAYPNSAFVGGFNFLGQADFGPAGSIVAWTPFTLPTGSTPAQLSVDNTGRILVADAGTDSVYFVDPASGGTITPVAASGPWGTNLNAGVVDPTSGDIYVGGNGTLWVLPCGRGTPVTYATGWTTGNGFVSGIIPDPIRGGIIASLLTVNRVVHIDGAGVLTDLAPPGAVTAPNAVAFSISSDILVTGNAGQVLSVPIAGGPTTTIGALGTSGNGSGLSVFGFSVSPGALFQTNCPEASLLVNNTFGFSVTPAQVTSPLGTPVSIQLDSTLVGNQWDLGYQTGPANPLGAVGFNLPNGNIVNVDLTGPSFQLLNNFFAGSAFTPLNLMVGSPTPLALSGQMAILDPATPGSIRTSAPAEVIFQ